MTSPLIALLYVSRTYTCMYMYSAIVHCISQVSFVTNLLYKRFCRLFSRALSSSSPLVANVFHQSSLMRMTYSFTGYNHKSVAILMLDSFMKPIIVLHLRLENYGRFIA